jgi:MinD superfamily P-loop ATPase
MHDLKRTVEICSKFNLKTWVIINKYDLNYEMSNQIEDYCNSINISVAGKLLFDSKVVEAMVNCKSIVEYAPKSAFVIELQTAFIKITNGKI